MTSRAEGCPAPSERASRLAGFEAAYSMEALCRNILAKNRGVIRVQKPQLAEVNLVRIIGATLSLANRQGFQATSLRRLALSSGMSMGGLYAYFDNKTTLLRMILGEVSDTVTTVLAAPPRRLLGDSAAHLAWLIETHILLTEAMQHWFAFAYMEAKAFPADAKRVAVQSERATEMIFEHVIEAGIAQGAMRFGRPDMAAALIKPLLQDWYVKRSKYRKRGISIDSYVTSVSAFVGCALGYHDVVGDALDRPVRIA